MRDVTISLDDAVADWARGWAQRHNTSISRMLGELLAEKMKQEERYRVAMEEFLAVAPSHLSAAEASVRPYPDRETVHER